MEEPLKAGQMLTFFDLLDAENMLMYASDYPHFDFDPPEVLPRGLSETARRKILHDNAADFFGLARARLISPGKNFPNSSAKASRRPTPNGITVGPRSFC